ncbi:GNAT family N-acetyltransferase [Myxosarcina sp. GI1]|uniref:GNAT family N-acetyltransferase n=1 Tax=Myxosarcina sp. GI1 TaxID=1541065 RepID=UPI0005628DBF|nr:GNAT family N-acetyltransferase [Myxosarcina sp. GI1]
MFIDLNNKSYLIRQATKSDLDLLDRLYTENMKGYVERVYPWNSKLFRDKFVPLEYLVLECNRQIVGFFKIVFERENIYLAEIQICSEYRNRGIGTDLLSSIIQQFGTTNRIWLKVIKGNPAINLYRRLGFKVFAESKTHLQMELLSQASN